MDDEIGSASCACASCTRSAARNSSSGSSDGSDGWGPQFASTGNYRIDALLYADTDRWNEIAPIGTPVAVSYSFLTSAGSSQDSFGFATMNDTQKNGARSAFAAWESVTNIKFVEVSTGGDIRLGTNNQGNESSAYAYAPGSGIGGDIYLSNVSFTNLDMSAGSYGYLTTLHEIGHAIGLKHPGDYNGTGSGEPPFLPANEDNINNTLMSYNEFGAPYPSSPRSYDIEAVQYLYGPEQNNITYRQSGDTLFTTGTSGTDVLIGFNLNDVLSGSDGVDTIFGDDGNDIIYGNRNTDSLEGGAGSDTIFGGQNNGPAGADGVLRQGSDTVHGGTGDDFIYGNHGSDLLYGDSGNDSIHGGQDADTISGGSGNDTINGGLGNDSMIGGSGDDIYFVNSVNDVVVEFSGGGTDRIFTTVQISTPSGVEFVTFIGSSAQSLPQALPSDWVLT